MTNIKDLTKDEKCLLNNARQQRYAIRALEDYSRLWESLESRLGKDSSKPYLDEFKKREETGDIIQPDRSEQRRYDTMYVVLYVKRVNPNFPVMELLFNR